MANVEDLVQNRIGGPDPQARQVGKQIQCSDEPGFENVSPSVVSLPTNWKRGGKEPRCQVARNWKYAETGIMNVARM